MTQMRDDPRHDHGATGRLRALLLAVLAGVASSSFVLVDARSSSADEHADEVKVSVRAMAYSPADIEITTGTTVVWRNEEAFDYPVVDGTHRARADDGSFDSGDLQPGQQFAMRFLQPGAFSYRCVIHPGIMTGSVTVTGDPITEVKDVEVGIEEPSQTDTQGWGFEPEELVITEGTTVTWRNNGAQAHTVTADDSSFDSGTIPSGGTWTFTFDEPMSVRYKCTPHPWMQGVIRVGAAGGPPPPPPPSRAPDPPRQPPAPEQPERTGDEPVTLDMRIVEPSLSDPQSWGYAPPTLRARKGDSVVWTNTGTVPHTVTATDGSFDSGTMQPGGTFRRTFDAVGTFTFACTPHPWMKGTVVVAAASAPRPVNAAPDAGEPPATPGETEDGAGRTPTEEPRIDEKAAARRALAAGTALISLLFTVALAVPSLRLRRRPPASPASDGALGSEPPSEIVLDDDGEKADAALVGSRL